MGVTVKNELGRAARDRLGEPVAAQEGPDRLPLLPQRRRRRRVVEQDHAQVAVLDRLQLPVERLDVQGRLGVDALEQRLAEVGQPGVQKAADEPLQPDDADADAAHRVDGRLALEHAHARVAQRGRDLLLLVHVPVVVSEHGHDRGRRVAAGGGKQLGLLHVSVSGQVPGEQDQVDPGQLREHVVPAPRGRLVDVEIARRGDRHPARGRLGGRAFAPPGCGSERAPHLGFQLLHGLPKV